MRQHRTWCSHAKQALLRNIKTVDTTPEGLEQFILRGEQRTCTIHTGLQLKVMYWRLERLLALLARILQANLDGQQAFPGLWAEQEGLSPIFAAQVFGTIALQLGA